MGITETTGREVALRGSSAPAVVRPGRSRRAMLLVIGVDLSIIVLVAADLAAAGTRLGNPPWIADDAAATGLFVVILVVAALAVRGCWDARELERGREEYLRVVRALTVCAVVVSLVALASKESALRPWAFVALPMTGFALVLARGARRSVTRRSRRRAGAMSNVLVAGGCTVVPRLVARARRMPQHGWHVVGACVLGGVAGEPVGGSVGMGDLTEVATIARTLAVDEVVVAGTGWSDRDLHRLAWELEGTQVGLVLEPLSRSAWPPPITAAAALTSMAASSAARRVRHRRRPALPTPSP